MRALVAACCLVFSAAAMSQHVYKCTQEDGKIIYQQKKCSGESIKLEQYHDQGGGLRGTESRILLERPGAYSGLNAASQRLKKDQEDRDYEFKQRTDRSHP